MLKKLSLCAVALLALFGSSLAQNVDSLGRVAESYLLGKQYASSLDAYLQLRQIYSKAGQTEALALADHNIGLVYKGWGVPEKAVENFEKAYNVLKDKNRPELTDILKNMGDAYYELGALPEALAAYHNLADKTKANMKTPDWLLGRFVDIHLALGAPEKALPYQEKILLSKTAGNDTEGAAVAVNNLGFLYKRLGNNEKALEYFGKSLSTGKPEPDKDAVTLTNMGIILQEIKNFPLAHEKFKAALAFRIQQKDPSLIAGAANYLGAAYYLSGDFDNAKKVFAEAEKTSASAKGPQAEAALSDTHLWLSKLYERQGQNKKSLEHYKLHTDLEQKVHANRLLLMKEDLKRQFLTEKKEKEMRLVMVDKEISDLNLKKLTLESEKKEKDLALLKQDRELKAAELARQELQKKQAVQELTLAQQQFEAEKRQRDIEELEKNDKIKSLALQQKELEQKEKEKGVQLLTKEYELVSQKQKMQGLELEKAGLELENEKETKKYFYAIIVLFVFFAGFVLFSYMMSRRANKALAYKNKEIEAKRQEIELQNATLTAQKQEILTQNEELEQMQDELIAQRDFIEDKNALLQTQNSLIEKANQDIQVLSDIGKEITSFLVLDDVLMSVYRHVKSLMPVSSFGVGMAKENAIYFRKAIENEQEVSGISHSMDTKSLSVWCFKKQEEIFFGDFETEKAAFLKERDVEVRISGSAASIIYLPITAKGNRLGVITVQTEQKNAYSDLHKAYFRTIASYTAIALDNAGVYEQVKEMGDLIQHKNERITDSIRYGERIQMAILASESLLADNFSDFFVFFKPQAIVSGDFYWFSKLKDKVFVAAVDCTGHGVPGAFMSMIGNTLLNEIVNAKHVEDPAEILRQLDAGIQKGLKQQESKNTDGMDVCLCRFEAPEASGGRKVYFAGAKRPLYVLENNEFVKIAPSRSSIGWMALVAPAVFFTNEIQLSKGALVFLSTDGFIDNQVGLQGRFGSKRFKEMALRIQHHPMQRQKEEFEKELRSLQGKEEQRDDITLIGLKI